jgi:hypothetical protein
MKTMPILVGFMVFLCLVSVAFAAHPEKMSVQGRLTDDNDNPLTGTYDMVLTLYTASVGGEEIWTETQTDVPVEDGIFNIYLGNVNPLNINFGDPYWVEVQIEGETLSPRVQLGSAGYSLNTIEYVDIITNKFAPVVSVVPTIFAMNTGSSIEALGIIQGEVLTANERIYIYADRDDSNGFGILKEGTGDGGLPPFFPFGNGEHTTQESGQYYDYYFSVPGRYDETNYPSALELWSGNQANDFLALAVGRGRISLFDSYDNAINASCQNWNCITYKGTCEDIDCTVYSAYSDTGGTGIYSNTVGGIAGNFIGTVLIEGPLQVAGTSHFTDLLTAQSGISVTGGNLFLSNDLVCAGGGSACLPTHTHSEYLLRGGGSMSGPLDMNGNTISEVVLQFASATANGNLNMNNHYINSVNWIKTNDIRTGHTGANYDWLTLSDSGGSNALSFYYNKNSASFFGPADSWAIETTGGDKLVLPYQTIVGADSDGTLTAGNVIKNGASVCTEHHIPKGGIGSNDFYVWTGRNPDECICRPNHRSGSTGAVMFWFYFGGSQREVFSMEDFIYEVMDSPGSTISAHPSSDRDILCICC